MKRNITHTAVTILFFTTLYMSLVPAARAEDENACSTAKAAGKWGFILSGTLLLPTGPVLGAGVGTATIDTAGNISGTEVRNLGGGFATETLTGTWTVNSDCTGTVSLQAYESGVLVRTSTLSLVFVNKLKEILMVQQSLILPDGTNLPVVITADAKRLSPDDGDDH